MAESWVVVKANQTAPQLSVAGEYEEVGPEAERQKY